MVPLYAIKKVTDIVEDLVNMRIGVEALDIFNKLTITSLFDANAVQTVGTENIDMGFVPGMIILAAIAIVFMWPE